MIELNITQPEGKSKNAKDIIFSILTKEQPLSQIEIFNRAKKLYNINLTYQAIRKAIETLIEQDIIKKDERKLSINKVWILDMKTFFDSLLTTYETKHNITSFKDEMIKENYAIYTFNNLLDLDNFWGDIMWHWIRNMKKIEPKRYFGYAHYSWWFLINLGRETRLLNEYIKKGINSYFIFYRDLPLNHWAADMQKNIGYKGKIKENIKLDEYTSFNIMGNYVIQIKYPKKIINKIREIYENNSSIEKINISTLSKLAHEPCEIKFIMFKNKEIADNLFDTYTKMIKYED